MIGYEVSTAVNRVTTDAPECVEPVATRSTGGDDQLRNED